jgi:glucosamine--fructose-6-phosphate aminotransferase (isomerizing)
MSLMRAEIDEAPDAVRRVLAGMPRIAEVAARIRELDPPFTTLAARGSSYHAGTVMRALIGRELGLVAAAVMPSLASVYRVPQRLKGALFVAISQSGRSPDLLACAEQARAAGALTLALVNDSDSPLARECELVLDIAAGPERSVAATKTVIATLATALALVRSWGGREAGLEALPDKLAAAPDWPQLAEVLASTPHIFTVGRGAALGIAQEAALKLAETCGIAGLAYSAAELAHGPMALAGRGFPVLAFLQDDVARPLSEALLETLAARATPVFAAGGTVAGVTALPVLPDGDADADLLPMLVSAYRAIEAAARARGLDPDHPRALQKVTRTV